MSPKHGLFCVMYVKHNRNGAKAYMACGYKAATEQIAAACANKLLKNAEIKAKIAQLLLEQDERVLVEADDILEEWKLIGKSDLGDILDFSGEQPKLKSANQIPVHARRAISSIKIKRQLDGRGEDAKPVEIMEFKLWDKNTALTNLAKHKGLLKEVIEHTGKNGTPITIVEIVRPASAVEQIVVPVVQGVDLGSIDEP